MTLTKMVDGVEIICTPEEEANIRAFWQMNTDNPEYADAVNFDWASPPDYDMVACRGIFTQDLTIAINNAVADLNNQIETMLDDGQDPLNLYSQRKATKALSSTDPSSCTTVDELNALRPEALLPYWPSQFNPR